MKIDIAEIRNNLDDALNRVAHQRERIVLEHRGKDIAAIVSIEDLALLEALEDRADTQAAREAVAEMKKKGQKPVSWEKVKNELGHGDLASTIERSDPKRLHGKGRVKRPAIRRPQ
jgi:prevent-host-death family protein